MRLDTDFYSSTQIELEVLYPALSPGGVLIVDD
jgi:O-methyltransferase